MPADTTPEARPRPPVQPPMTLTLPGVARGAARFAGLAPLVVPFGLAYGAAAAAAGFAPRDAIILSAVVFAGAAQFAALEVWADPPPYLVIAALALSVNARFVVMGAALARWVNAAPPAARLATMPFLADASFALSQAAFRGGERDLGLLLGGGLALWIAWVGGTALGAGLGGGAGALDRFGVDVVMACFFAAVIAPGLKLPANRLPVFVGAAVGVAAMDLLPTGWSVIAGALAGGLAAAARPAP